MRAFASVLVVTLLCLLGASPVAADFTFVHITDTHVTATDAEDSNAAKDAALYKEINGWTPKPAFVVNTGDVCEVGTDAEYEFYQKSLTALAVPVYAAPGNHDVRWNPRGKEGYTRGAKQPLYQSWDYENVHFVLLDSTVLLQHWGHFDQAQLDWLARDLKKVGRKKPVVIGFHHFIARPGSAMVDNAPALLKVLEPYNVRLFLIGHGHSDIEWSINGTPAIMAKGLYQGSYHLIKVTKNRLTVYRRTQKDPSPTEILSTSLRPTPVPRREATVNIKDGNGTVRFASGEIPKEATVTLRFDAGEEQPMPLAAEYPPNTGSKTQKNPKSAVNIWEGRFTLFTATAGQHQVTVTATLPNKRAYQTTIPVSLEGPNSARPLWKTNIGGGVQGEIVKVNDTVYVPSMGGDLVALQAVDGKERWRFKTGGVVFSTPLVINDTVYFGSADHFVYAVEAATGKLKWKMETQGAVFSGAALAQDTLCIASTDTKIYGLNPTSGEVKWTVQGENMYQSQATTDGERFFVGGWDNQFRAIDARTGQELWKQTFGKTKDDKVLFYFAPAIGSPTVGGDKVYVTSNDGLLHAMDRMTGEVKWEVRGPSLGYSGPLYREGKIYNASLTDKGRVFCFNETDGKAIWETLTGSVIYDSSCAFGGGNIFVGCVDGTFSALRASDGVLQWQYRLAPGHLLASPAADDERVYIGSLNGEVVAFPVNSPSPARSVQSLR